MTGKCTVPPPGWWCSREAGHDGPCAARPDDAEKIAREPPEPELERLIHASMSRDFKRVRQLLQDNSNGDGVP